MKILIVEDDALIANALTEILSDQTYAVEVATDGQTGWDLLETYSYDLVLLDVMLPQLDGISLCKKLRSHHYTMPVLLLTGRDSGHDKAVGLDAGADDYVVKPFDPEELVARIRALLRRGSTVANPILEWGDLCLDPTLCEVTWQGKPVALTSKEYALMELFLRNRRRVFSCGMILEHLWAYDTMPGEEAVRTHIKCLRQKFKAAGIPTDLVETVYGIGYKLKAEPETAPLADLSPANSKQQASSQLTPPAEAPYQQHMKTAIAGIWERHKDRVSEQISVIEQAAIALAHGKPERELHQQAYQEAHTLAGSLGTFGFMQGSELARQIEGLLKPEKRLKPSNINTLQSLVEQLRHEIDPPVVSPSAASELPVLLIVDRNSAATKDLVNAANSQGWRTLVSHDLASTRSHLTQHTPAAVLVDPTCLPDTPERLEFLQTLSHSKPAIPILIYTTQDSLSDRLQFAQMKGCTFLHKPLSAQTILDTVQQLRHRETTMEARLMAVDDDPKVLALLQTLLEPWGLHVTTLDDSRRFWETLEQTAPDLLILDVEMPHVGGIELCQVVRNDAQWGGLPILFLTAHTDAEIVNRVFAAGADDFVSKPIVGPELVARIISRLERIKLLQNLQACWQSQRPTLQSNDLQMRNSA
ncbi:response regulator [Oscillatoria sp. FACHB-1407]|uniref:response regulator n=1 Tax=Oscillatoria sp. FACHB-1407 TaxID=2692847 RepID=UPI00168998A0|nr:response regulator [Oscillatoria sp. FACHB-1407]MBD2460968.1 response regulator [Oscillatoria sp. FACHB-1407]